MANAPQTQLAAHASIRSNAQVVRDRVLDAIKTFGAEGLTAHECSAVLDLDNTTVQPRTSELFADGLIIDSGQRRKNKSGKRAIVWIGR